MNYGRMLTSGTSKVKLLPSARERRVCIADQLLLVRGVASAAAVRDAASWQ